MVRPPVSGADIMKISLARMQQHASRTRETGNPAEALLPKEPNNTCTSKPTHLYVCLVYHAVHHRDRAPDSVGKRADLNNNDSSRSSSADGASKRDGAVIADGIDKCDCTSPKSVGWAAGGGRVRSYFSRNALGVAVSFDGSIAAAASTTDLQARKTEHTCIVHHRRSSQTVK